MDPDEVLTRVRDAIAALADGGGIEEAAELIDAFNDLDDWLSRGGFLPSAWSESSDE